MKYSINGSTVALNKDILSEESLNTMIKEIDSSYNSCSKAIEAYNLVSNVKAMENFGYKATEGLGESIKNGAKAVWEKIKEFFRKIVEFFKFIGKMTLQFFSYIQNLIRLATSKISRRKQKPLTQQQISEITKNLDGIWDFDTYKTQDSLQLQNTISKEANGEYALQRTSNVKAAEIRTGQTTEQLTKDLADFLSKHKYFIEYDSRYLGQNTVAYSLHYVVAEFYGKENVDKLIQEYKQVSEQFKKYLNNFANGSIDQNTNFDKFEHIKRNDFWKFGNFDSVSRDKTFIAQYVLRNYSSDITVKLGNDSKKLIEVLNKECKINLAVAENQEKAITKLQESDPSNSSGMKEYYSIVQNNIREFVSINKDLIDLCKRTISLSSDLEKLYSKIDKFLVTK